MNVCVEAINRGIYEWIFFVHLLHCTVCTILPSAQAIRIDDRQIIIMQHWRLHFIILTFRINQSFILFSFDVVSVGKKLDCGNYITKCWEIGPTMPQHQKIKSQHFMIIYSIFFRCPNTSAACNI